MKKDPRYFIEHILDSIKKIEGYTKGLSKEEFLRDSQVQDAVLRRLEIVGEAAKNLPSDFKERYADVSWRQIAGMRDVIIHEYFGVDLDLVWATVKKDLPALKQKINNIVK